MNFQEFLLTESINDKGRLKALMVIGSAGAGKSYTISQLNGVVTPKIVNTDRFLEFYAKKIGVKATPDNWRSLFREKTKATTEKMTYNYLNGLLPLFIDSTSNNVSNIISRTAVLESIGYDVGYVFVNANIETVLKRVQDRNSKIDREVDLDFVKKVHSKVNDDVEFLRNKGNFFLEINNSEGELTNEIINAVFKKAQGFFSGELKNPIGKRIISEMEETKQKYLVPEVYSEEDLKKKVERWYK